jgi:transglutaminase-like putative cysteine protease
MFIRIGFEIQIDSVQSVPMLLALRPHSTFAGRVIGSDEVRTDPSIAMENYLDVFGNRRTRLVTPGGQLTLWSDCIVEDDGQPDVFNWNAKQNEVADLPADVLTYLIASRYCETDELVARAWKLFGETPPGWARVQAICNFVHNNVTFGYGFGRSSKTAQDALRERTGVCRDFAQLAIALCRAMNIPARYASGYLGDIGVPPAGAGDFCAWFEVFLDDRWYTFDARYNTPRIGRVLMVHGRDAADAAIITAFGDYTLKLFRVWTDEVPGMHSDAALLDMLKTRPDAEAMVLAAS